MYLSQWLWFLELINVRAAIFDSIAVEGFCGGNEKLKHVLMGHEIFLKNVDGSRNIFLFSPLVISSFEHECKISKLAIKEI